MRILTIFCLFVFLACFTEAYSQTALTRKGDKYYLKGEWFAALDNYKKAESEGTLLDTRTTINKAICMYHLNDIDNAFNILLENQDKLVGEEILLFAMTSHKFGFYDGAIEWYEKAKNAGANPAQIDELIASCKWALNNIDFKSSVRVNPVPELYTDGQSFGIQYYKKGIVYSSAEEAEGNKTLDKMGKEILNLYITDLVDGKVTTNKRIFSKNLVFPEHVGAISFTSDNAMMYYSRVVRVKGGDTQVKIFSVEFDGKDWVNETELNINSNTYSCAQPAVSPDNRYLYFVSNKPGGYGDKDIYFCERSKTGELGEVKNLGSDINTFGEESYPFVSKGNVLYFSSSGRKGFGGLDIYSANKVGNKWGNITNLMQPYNSYKDDFGFVMDPNDANRGFLSSNRLGTGQNDAIFSIEKKPVVDSVKVAPPVEVKKDSVVAVAEIAQITEPIVVPPVAVSPVVSPPVEVEPIVEPPVVAPPVEVVPVVAAPPVSNLPKSLSSSVISTFNGTPIQGVKVSLKDLTTDKIIGEVTSDGAGKFMIELPETSREDGREFEINLSKGDDFNAKKMVVNIQEIEDLNKNGFSLTPIFHNAVLDDISGMVIPYVGIQITPEGQKVLDSLAAYLLKNSNIVIKLNGHTDARGDKLNNLRVSQTMAEKAEKLLIEKGVKDENIIPRSYGERYIINKCKRGVACDNATHLVNRRIEVVVWRMSK